MNLPSLIIAVQLDIFDCCALKYFFSVVNRSSRYRGTMKISKNTIQTIMKFEVLYV